MMFDGSEEEQKARGFDAARILAGETFQLAEKELKEEIQAAWLKETDAAKRDALWHKARAIDCLREKLEAIQANGEQSGERLRNQGLV